MDISGDRIGAVKSMIQLLERQPAIDDMDALMRQIDIKLRQLDAI